MRLCGTHVHACCAAAEASSWLCVGGHRSAAGACGRLHWMAENAETAAWGEQSSGGPSAGRVRRGSGAAVSSAAEDPVCRRAAAGLFGRMHWMWESAPTAAGQVLVSARPRAGLALAAATAAAAGRVPAFGVGGPWAAAGLFGRVRLMAESAQTVARRGYSSGGLSAWRVQRESRAAAAAAAAGGDGRQGRCGATAREWRDALSSRQR